MKLLNIMGNSFGCSASGERLVTAARDGDLQEATALLECNPRLARYSTFGVRNSPLHYSAAQGHHEIVSLLLVSGVDINLRNYRGQTALMQACQHGHWEVVLTLILFKANIHRADYLNGGTALHLAALNGHARCIRLVLADYIPSIADCWTLLRNRGFGDEGIHEFDKSALHEVINRPADGGITAMHMAALNGHMESVQLLLDLGASISNVTVEDGSTIDLIGAGSTPLHYAACGGNAQCCQILIARGASLVAENANGWTPLMVARSWRRTELEEILRTQPGHRLPLWNVDGGMVILFLHARNLVLFVWRESALLLQKDVLMNFAHRVRYICAAPSPPLLNALPDPWLVLFVGMALFLLLNSQRHGQQPRAIARTSLSLSLCSCSCEEPEPTSITTPLCKPEIHCANISPLSSSFRSLSCQNFPSFKLNASRCIGAEDTSPSLVRSSLDPSIRGRLVRYSKPRLRRSASNNDQRRSWLSAINDYVTIGSGC